MSTTTRLDEVERAIADVAAGRPVIVVDDDDRENEGDIVFAAATATPDLMAWTVRHSSGVICVAMPGEELDRLRIPPMTQRNEDRMRTAYAVSVDARDGVGTGISAADRARTVRALADPRTEPTDLARPGHVFPLRYREGGVLVRRGHTEAAVDVARLTGLPPVGVLAEVVNDDGTMCRGEQLRGFADVHGVALVSIDQLARHRRRSERLVVRGAQTRLPTRHGAFTAIGYASTIDGSEHVALVHADPGSLASGDPVLVRVHSECLTGDVFGSLRCDCGPQLDDALGRIAAAGSGIVVYLRGHEGRGIGLVSKLRAYALQDRGRDTVDANLDLGLPVDDRDYGVAAQILRDLGVGTVHLMTNNPDKVASLRGDGVDVAQRVPLPPRATAENVAYLQAKRDRLGHHVDQLAPAVPGPRTEGVI